MGSRPSPLSQHALQDCVSVSGSALRWSCGPSRRPRKHPRTCPRLSCCCPVVGRPDCSPGPACPPRWQEAGGHPGHPWKHPRTCPRICRCCPVVGCPDRPPGSACPPRWQETGSNPPCRCFPRSLPQLPLLQPRPRGAPWICQHCWLPCRRQCCCLPWIPILLNNKAFTLCNSSRQEKTSHTTKN